VCADAHLPARYWGATPNAIHRAPEVKRFLTERCEDPTWMAEGRGFYFHGPLNSGKSSAAAVLMMDALQRCEKALWLSVRDVASVRFRENERSAEIDDALQAADLLVLDDLGSERFRLSSAAGAALEETIRICYDRQRPVIITSNLGWDQFESHYKDEAEPLVSVVQRFVEPVAVVNDQWGRAR
jgi:DNA replication protein DnaC